MSAAMSIGVTETEALRLFRDDQRDLKPPVKFRGGAHAAKLVEAFGALPREEHDKYLQRAEEILQELESQPGSQSQQDERTKQPRIDTMFCEQSARMSASSAQSIPVASQVAETQQATPSMVAVALSF